MTVKQLQVMFGFRTPTAIYRWEQGASIPTIDNLVVLAHIFKVPIDDILVVDYA